MSLKPAFIISILCSAILLQSCKECKEGSGHIITEDRTTNGMWFDEVESNVSCTVYLYKSPTYQVLVEGDDNLIAYYSTKISDGRLYIDLNTSNCIKDEESVCIHVYAPYFNKITQDGSGYLECDTIAQNSLETMLSGSGDIVILNTDVTLLDATVYGSGNIELAGSARSANFNVKSSGQIKAFKLGVDECDATITSSGNIYTFFYDALTIDIPGSGTVFFKGDDRRVLVRITGSGQVVDSNKK